MGVPKTANTETAGLDQEAQDEINEIMSEIESLQRELDEPASEAVAAAPERPKLRAVPAAADMETDSGESPVESDDSLGGVEDLGDFHGGSDEPSIEETLGDLKHEEPASDSLLAQSLAATADDEDVALVSDDSDETFTEETLDPDVPEELAQFMSDEPDEITDEQADIMAAAARRSIEEGNRAVKEPVEAAARAFAETTRERSAPKASTTEEGCLQMTLTGNMTLKLKYEFGGQEVTVGFSDHALRVELSDGTEFKIPIRKSKAA